MGKKVITIYNSSHKNHHLKHPILICHNSVLYYKSTNLNTTTTGAAVNHHLRSNTMNAN